MSGPMVRPLRRGELYLMVTSLPFRVTLAVAGGLAGWAKLAVTRRVQQAAVARVRKNMANLSFWVRVRCEGSIVRDDLRTGFDVRHDAQLERLGLSTRGDHARLKGRARSSAG